MLPDPAEGAAQESRDEDESISSRPSVAPAHMVCLVQFRGLAGAAKLHRVLTALARCEVRRFPFFDELVANLAPAKPAMVVAPLATAQPTQLKRCADWLRTVGAPSGVVLAGLEPAKPEVLRIFDGVSGAQVISGAPRITARLVEAVVVAFGVRPRIHPRLDSEALDGARTGLAGTLQRAAGTIEHFSLLNLSESGVLIRLNRKLETGIPVQLRFALDDQSFEVEGIPMRQLRNPQGSIDVGVQFDDPPNALIQAVRELVERSGAAESPIQEQPIRTAPRLRLPPQIKVSVRLQVVGQKRMDYGIATDLSATGLAMLCPPEVRIELKAGDRALLLITWRGRGFRLQATVSRLGLMGDRQSVALHFDALARAEREQLSVLLSQLAGSPSDDALRQR
jgi:hypothetical protein